MMVNPFMANNLHGILETPNDEEGYIKEIHMGQEALRMTYNEFIDEMKFYLINEFGHNESDIRIMPKGMTGETELEKTIIDDSNRRYFNREDQQLLGNFLITEWPRPATQKEPGSFERFNLDALYEDCQQNGFDSVLEKIRQGKEESKLTDKSDSLDHTDDYEFTKDKLIVRPLNYKNSRNALKDFIYRRVGDIALVLYIIISHEGENYMSGKVPREMIKSWGKSEDDLLNGALLNTQRLHPAKAAKIIHEPFPKFVDMGLVENIPDAEFHDARYISLFGKDNPNGAISLFFPGMTDFLYKKVGGDFYAVFTSISDVAIHSVKANDIKELKFKLNHVNANLNSQDMILSRKVYKYNGKELAGMD